MCIRDRDGTQQVIYDERSPKYVDHLNKTFYCLEDGRRFIVREETSTGYMHLYLYGIGQGVLHPITQLTLDVAMALSAAKVKVTALSARSMPDGHATVNIVVEVRDKDELGAVINKLNNIQGVYHVARSSGK